MSLSASTQSFSLLTDLDIHLFREGKHYRLYEKLGSHLVEHLGVKGTYFSVWAPNGQNVSVIGNFNGWNRYAHPLEPRPDGSGIWEGFIPAIGHGEVYKYAITAPSGHHLEKGDPFARRWENPPRTASIVWELDYKWKDKKWLNARKKKAGNPQPCQRNELYPCRVYARHGTPLRSILGLSDHRIFCADCKIWNTRRIYANGRCLS